MIDKSYEPDDVITVADLIDLLQELPLDASVYVVACIEDKLGAFHDYEPMTERTHAQQCAHVKELNRVFLGRI